MQSLLFLSFFLLSASGAPLTGTGEFVRLQEPSFLPASRKAFLDLTVEAVNPTEFIFGGIKAEPGQIPQQALFSYKTSTGQSKICGGTLISPSHVLTAAHCTLNIVSGVIMVGAVNRFDDSPNAQWRNIHGVVNHEKYDPKDPNVNNDISVLEFSPPVVLNRDVQVAKLVSDDDVLFSANPMAIVSGYGLYKGENETVQLSGDLLYTAVPFVAFSVCNKAWSDTLTYKQICAGAAGKGIGSGDSGGPLQVFYEDQLFQVGIASFVNDKTAPDHQDQLPAVFTRVSQYCIFIENATKGVVKCGTVIPEPIPTLPDCITAAPVQ